MTTKVVNFRDACDWHRNHVDFDIKTNSTFYSNKNCKLYIKWLKNSVCLKIEVCAFFNQNPFDKIFLRKECHWSYSGVKFAYPSTKWISHCKYRFVLYTVKDGMIFYSFLWLSQSRLTLTDGVSWSWSYSSWIYNYLCNQCLSPLMLWVLIPPKRGVPNTTLCDKVVSDLRQISGFLRVLRFPPTIKLIATIQLKYCWKWH